MKAICFLLLALSVAFASDYTYDEGVLVVTTSNFAKVLEEFDFALVEFYAPWCGHCKSLAPEYAKAAQALAESHPNVKLCKVDATVENDLAEKFEIGGFPTLKFFRKGHTEPADYNGGRTSGDIINWLKKRTGDLVAAVNSVEEVEKQIADSDALVLFLGNTASEVYTNFLQTAALFDEVTFIHTDNAEVRQKFDGTENGLIIFADGGAEKKVYSGDNSVESFKTFVNTHRFPLVLPFNQNAAQKIFGEELDAIFLIISNNDAGKQAKAVFRTVAEELQNKIAFSVADIGEDLGGRLAEFVGVSEGDLPAIRIAQPSAGMKKFVLEQEITADNIKKFIGDFLDGKLTAHFKSEAIPAESHDGNVRVVVGKNFKEVVLDETKDVLLELYAPWCGHCKQLAPIYETLAAKLRSYNDIVIAKMDATANEVEGLEIEGFPTIRLYPKNKKGSPIEFEGDRSEDGFIDFLKQNGSVTIDIQTGGSSSHDHSHHDHAHHDHAHHDHAHHDHDHGHEKKVVQDEL